MMSMNLCNIAILNNNGAGYLCIIIRIFKSDSVNLQKADSNEKSRTLENIKKLFSNIKMGKEILTFGDTEFEKNRFYLNESPIFSEDVDINNVLVSNEISSGKKKTNCKYFISYLYDNYEIRPLSIIMFPKRKHT